MTLKKISISHISKIDIKILLLFLYKILKYQFKIKIYTICMLYF